MKTNGNIVFKLFKIRQANHKIIKDYLDLFTNIIKKLDTIFGDSIQTL